MIPSDVGVRMRLQSEATLHPVAPIAEIPADVADFHAGQVFSARIQEVLPENTYKALVAGRSLTLSLPEGAKAGDTLDLVVVDRTPHTIVARLANRDNAATTAGDLHQFTTLSPAARIIGTLLARDGDAPAPALLNRGQPLLAQTPINAGSIAAQLAPQLAKAVSQSGLFYEAHQVQWVQGQKPLTELLTEPQAAHSSPETLAAYRQSVKTAPAPGNMQEFGPLSLLQGMFAPEEAVAPHTPQATPPTPAQAVPEELRPLIQQQLDAVATQRLAWHGEVWPGQTLHGEIQPDDHPDGRREQDTEQGWITSLHLTMPRLGGVTARIHLTSQGVRIGITAPLDATAAHLRDAVPALGSALVAAGIPLLAAHISNVDQA